VALLPKLAAMVALLALGVGARQVGVLTPSRRDALNAVAFYVALPALVFEATATRQVSEIVSVPLLAGFWAVLFGTLAVGWLAHRSADSPAQKSVALVQSYHGNLGYLGLPLVSTTFGALAAAKASLILGIGALTQVPITVGVLVALNGADADPLAEAKGIATNPVLVALVAGLAVGQVQLGVPGLVMDGLGALSVLALPIALLCVGASLSLERAAVPYRIVGTTVALKVFLMPALALLAFGLLDASTATRSAGVVMLAMPSAVSTYVYASELGGDDQLASLNVFATTVVSMATLLVVVQLVS